MAIAMGDVWIGQPVLFGRKAGEKTRGEIVKINPKKAKVRTTEERGRGRPAGEVWSVPYFLLQPVPGAERPVIPARKPEYKPDNSPMGRFKAAVFCPGRPYPLPGVRSETDRTAFVYVDRGAGQVTVGMVVVTPTGFFRLVDDEGETSTYSDPKKAADAAVRLWHTRKPAN